MKPFDIVVAYDQKRGIAKNGTVPWRIKEDLQWFHRITTLVMSETNKNAVIMGRKTYLSIPDRFRPLKDRHNIVISNTLKDLPLDVITATDFEDALCKAISLENAENIFVIGGEQVYKEAITHPYKRYIYATKIDQDFDCDQFFPSFSFKSQHNYYGMVWGGSATTNANVMQYDLQGLMHEEYQYVNMLKDILENGDKRQTRNGITYSLFGGNMKFNLTRGFPLLTTKKMFMRGIFEELKFFLTGQTDTNLLKTKGVNFWNANTTQEFINDLNLPYQEGDMGAMYGFQFRHYGAEYKDKDQDYANQGFDQLQYVINEIKNNPTSRRIIMTSFNPVDAKTKSVLYPCHSIVLQFYVTKNNALDCHVYNRSQDMFLGSCFNIASTALLVNILSKICKLLPGTLHMSFGDVHIYEEHVEVCKIQISREPYKFPILKINKELSSIADLGSLEYSDLEILNYKCHDTIKAPMKA